jgi:capsule synthesis protein PGA_cap
MRHSPRFWVFVCFIAALLLVLPWKPAVAAGNQVVLVVGGDVEWSLNSRPPTVRYPVVEPGPFGQLVVGKRDVPSDGRRGGARDQVIGDWPPIPYVNKGESKAYLESLDLKGGTAGTVGEGLSYPLPPPRPDYTQDYSSNQELLSYPLRRLAPTFHAADLVFVNCEGALSDHGRQVGLNRTPEKFAKILRSSGVGIVNLANNHAFDAEERGFLDTLRVLSSAGIGHVGGGLDLAAARSRPSSRGMASSSASLAIRSSIISARSHSLPTTVLGLLPWIHF